MAAGVLGVEPGEFGVMEISPHMYRLDRTLIQGTIVLPSL